MQFKPLTNQEAFDKALFGIRAQGYLQSISENDKCAYRGEDGRKCAIGHCLPDELAEEIKWLDTATFSSWSSIRKAPEFAEFSSVKMLQGCNPSLLSELQNVHDSMQDKENFEDRMQEIAQFYDLVYTPVSA